jgi:hypothetical protein
MRGLVFALVLAGCAQSDAEKADAVCNTFCACTTGGDLPAVVEQCVMNDCLPALQEPVTDLCLTCVHSHESTCPSLLNACSQLCTSPPPPGP